MNEVREKCAVVGIYSHGDGEVPVSQMGYEMLHAQQHRGAEASGLAVAGKDDELRFHRDAGMVKDVYDEGVLENLEGELLVGHNRYSTDGDKGRHFQPFVEQLTGFAFAHNGNLPLTDRLETNLRMHNINSGRLNDSEMMGAAIANYLRDGHPLPDAVELAYPLFRGAFSCVAMHDGLLVAFRDSKGIRPLALGTTEDGSTVISSETCGLEIVDAAYEREVEPGELVVVSKDGVEQRTLADATPKLDIFEFVYFARHDSRLHGQSVNEVRRRFGEKLAQEHPPAFGEKKDIVVIPVPDTSVPAAEGYAESQQLICRQGIIKNRYIGRTFMGPSPGKRVESLRRKHNIVPEAVHGKDVILIDDSIVRLNTIPRLVQLAQNLGAKTVNVLIASPPVRFPDFYGIDTPSQDELAAANLTIEQMRQKIGSDYLGFLSLGGMVEATGMPADRFNLASFNGDYPIGIGALKKQIRTPVSMEFAE